MDMMLACLLVLPATFCSNTCWLHNKTATHTLALWLTGVLRVSGEAWKVGLLQSPERRVPRVAGQMETKKTTLPLPAYETHDLQDRRCIRMTAQILCIFPFPRAIPAQKAQGLGG